MTRTLTSCAVYEDEETLGTIWSSDIEAEDSA